MRRPHLLSSIIFTFYYFMHFIINLSYNRHYDFSILFTKLPHNLIKEKLTELIEQKFNRDGSLYLACNDKNALFTSEQPKRSKLWSRQKCVILSIIF